MSSFSRFIGGFIMNKTVSYLAKLGITLYEPWQQPVPQAAALSDQEWQTLGQQVATCEKCDLCKTRKNTVFGVGNPQAKLMLVGEAPGATEDQRGEPFVGEAGQLLDKMIAAIGESRQTLFIANILKCRPPGNRDPLPFEVAQCMPYLLKQIEWIQPKLILALGRVAAHNLLQTQTALSKLRGQIFHFGVQQIPLIVTYHPAYLLRNPAEKRNAWIDLQRVQAMLGLN